MFYSKINGGNEYECLEPTDILLYDKNDVEHVGWFWIPYEAGQPIWLAPYFNQNNGILMISYVIPLYNAGRFIGVVGMDFDYKVLTEKIHSIKIYENGYAYLTLNDVVISTDTESTTDDYADIASEDYLQVSETLGNGMQLVLLASYDDIRQIRYEIAYKILISVLLLTLVFAFIVFFMVKRTVKPLQKLTEASAKIADGDYDVEIEHSDTYEIKQLSTAFEAMLINLREHKRLQHQLAYRDSMTGLRNTTSYKKWTVDFDKKVQAGENVFGIVMLDVNCLKETNDTYCHEIGNKLLITSAKLISDTFKRSPVFRIGCDEFVAILQNRDFEDRDELFTRFETDCAATFIETPDGPLPVRIAMGFALFDPETDTQFLDVFTRADEEMYRNKKAMKADKA
jgi:diguanylate cyclase (GGDEF)-like protein